MRRPALGMDEHLLSEQHSHPNDMWSFANALSYCFTYTKEVPRQRTPVSRCFWGRCFCFNI